MSKCPGRSIRKAVPWLLEATQNGPGRPLLAYVAIRDFAHFLIGGRNASELNETEPINMQCLLGTGKTLKAQYFRFLGKKLK